MTETTLQPAEQQIGNYIGRLLRDHFGKGPESVFVSIGYTFMTIYLRNFLSPMEKVLMEQDQTKIVAEMRQKLMNTLVPQMKAYIEIVTGQCLREFYYDWSFHNRSGMLMGISSAPFEEGAVIQEDYVGKAQVIEEINRISHETEKVSEETYSCELNSRTIIVIRNGLLVRIEKELVRAGQGELLKIVKANLEKSYLHNNPLFQIVLQRRVVDCFVDWNFDLDKSVIVFVLNPKPL